MSMARWLGGELKAVDFLAIVAAVPANRLTTAPYVSLNRQFLSCTAP